MWLLVVGAVFLVNNAINIQYAYGCCDDSVIERIDQLEKKVLDAIEGLKTRTPKSCDEILSSNPKAPSGEYTINSGLGDQKVFCQMGTLPGCGRGGWRRIAFFDRTSASVSCPTGFTSFQSSGKVACQRAGVGCTGLKFNPGQTYKEVCGMVKGYRLGTVDSFRRYSSHGNINNINSAYVDGVSITQGSPRRHLWSYATTYNSGSHIYCPCTGKSSQVPNFIKNNNYYCEGGTGAGVNNVLWDGKGCTSYENSGCCNRPNLPWFHRKDITQSSDFIELRLCSDEPVRNERIPIFQYQLYVR